MKKTWVNILIYAIVLLGVVIIAGIADGRLADRPCAGIKPLIHNQTGNEFLDARKVREMVREVHGAMVENDKVGNLPLAEIESTLLGNPYVRKVEVYVDAENYLVADMILRKPVARVMGKQGIDYYLDREGHKLPLSDDFTANTVLLRGDIKEPFAPYDSLGDKTLNQMMPMLNFIDSDEFLQAQISEIVMDDQGKLTLYPEVGDVTIYFGEPEDWTVKFIKMNLFYHQVLNQAGWDTYKSIDLQYKDQVVAKKD